MAICGRQRRDGCRDREDRDDLAQPLLSWYADIFEQVVSAGDVRLMIAGYGFGDAHINAVIAQAIENHALSVFIWNTMPDLKGAVFRRRMAHASGKV